MTRWDHGRGVSVALAIAAMTLLGMPGLDMVGEKSFVPGSIERSEVLEQPLGFVAVGAADANRALREPIVRWLTPLQRPLRLAQAWHVYGSGPRDVRHFEVRVDDELVYRSGDPDHSWHRAVFRYRRVRPVVDAYCTGSSRNKEGLMLYVAGAARRDFPGATKVAIGCTVVPHDGSKPARTRHVRQVAAPDWGVP